MTNDKIIKIGVECENIEDSKSRWGVGQVTFNLLKEYAENSEWQNKYKFYLYFKKRVPDDELFKIHSSKFTIRVLGFPSFNIFYHILMPFRAMFDGLDWMFFPSYMLPPLYIGKSVVMLTNDVYYEYKHGSLPLRYRLAYRLFTNWAAKFATKILAISESSKKEVARLYGIKPEKIFVSYLGIDSKLTTHNLRPTTYNYPYILYVGQMFPRRHARETILAFQKIITNHSDILKNIGMSDLKLIMIGKDKYQPALIGDLVKKVNSELGRERIEHYDYIENRDKIDELYAGAKALVYVSDQEAFGLPPMEALAYGVAPVITDNELGHELFGEYAFYSKSGDPEDIAQTIIKTLTDNAKTDKIKSEGPVFVKKYDWKIFAGKFLKNVEN